MSDYEGVRVNKGFNNQITIKSDGCSKHIVKKFDMSNPLSRYKFSAEVNFLKYASEVAPNYVPRFISSNKTTGSISMSYIEGLDLSSDDINCDDIAHARSFFLRLNDNIFNSKYASLLSSASEGGVSLDGHIRLTQGRINRLKTSNILPDYTNDFTILLQLIIKYLSLITNAAQQSNSLIATLESLRHNLFCISPGDFGFHNALRTETGLVFFDFEHSGFDDLAKCIIDFKFQPSFSPTISIDDYFLCDSVDLHPLLKEYIFYLRPILCLRWACIALNGATIKKASQICNYARNDISISELANDRLNNAKSYIRFFEMNFKSVFG